MKEKQQIFKNNTHTHYETYFLLLKNGWKLWVEYGDVSEGGIFNECEVPKKRLLEAVKLMASVINDFGVPQAGSCFEDSLVICNIHSVYYLANEKILKINIEYYD